MKFSYTFVVLLIIQLALKYVKADLGSKDMACENGIVVQYGRSYECKCNTGYIHESLTKCVTSDSVVVPCTAKTVGQICGEFAKCAADPKNPDKYVCMCNPGYTPKPAQGEGCMPASCKNKNCGKGVCVVDSNKPVCSCFINHKNKTDSDKASECVAGGEHTCDLTCVPNAHCELHKEGYFFCECINKEPMVNGACTASSNAITSFLSPFHVLFIIGVCIFYLKSA